MTKPKYYITTAIAYTSRKPHIGNAYDIVLADMIARYKRMMGFDVYFMTGSDEHGQKIEDCARRELFEEMGITAGELELFYINSGPEAHYVYPNGDEVSNVEIVYICRDYRGEIRPQQEEIEEIRYFSVDEIQMEEISPPIRPVLQKYKETFE